MSRLFAPRAMLAVCACVLVAAFAAPRAAGQSKEKEPATIILKGAPIGGVKFDHKLHAKDRAAGKCETCHHASKAEKPSKVAHQKCTDCHTKVATAPMKTKTQAAFHDPMAKAGVCITCHTAENAKGKKAPTKCMDCHKKENL